MRRSISSREAVGASRSYKLLEESDRLGRAVILRQIIQHLQAIAPRPIDIFARHGMQRDLANRDIGLARRGEIQAPPPADGE